jgi:hypothetical protein
MNIIKIKSGSRRSSTIALVVSSLMLVIFATFVMSNVAFAEMSPCPDGFTDWGIGGHSIELSEGCTLYYHICYRNTTPNGQGGFYYEYYIGDLMLIPAGCMDQLEFLAKYNDLIDSCMMDIALNHANFSIIDFSNCFEGQSFPIFRVGHPSCISDIYFNCSVDYNNNCICGDVATSCSLLSETSVCWSIYTYCWETIIGPNGPDGVRLKQTKQNDGTEWTVCPESITVVPKFCIEVENPVSKTLNCNPVCGD